MVKTERAQAHQLLLITAQSLVITQSVMNRGVKMKEVDLWTYIMG